MFAEEFIKYISEYNQCLDALPNWIFLAMSVVGLWSLVWKGIALWKASKYKSMPWFVVLLITNTVGILEILYIFWLNKYGRKA